jgi:excisionase family DNA binding protein
MTAGEAAQFLKTSKTYVFKMIREGELPVIKRGKRYTRLMRTDLVAFLQRHRKEAIPAKEVQR